MIKEPTRSDIEAIKLVMRAYEDKKNLINLQAKKYSINDLFVEEFEQYLTKESFSGSPALKFAMIKKYKEFFDFEVWAQNKEKSLEPLLFDEFVDEYSVKGEELDKVISNTNPENFTKVVFDKYFSSLGYETKKFVINFTALSGDPQFLTENAELITSDIFKNRKVKIDWTNDLIEKIFTNKTLTVRFLINTLYQSKDLAFIRRMLTTPFNYKDSGETFDVDLKNIIIKLSENYMKELFDIVRAHNKNALSYEVMSFILKVKDDLEEDFLVENVDLFIENGLMGDLATYARSRDYRSVMIVLKLN